MALKDWNLEASEEYETTQSIKRKLNTKIKDLEKELEHEINFLGAPQPITIKNLRYLRRERDNK